MKFKAFVVREVSENRFERKIEERRLDDLTGGDVLIRVKYSSLNYKDALSAIGNRGVTKAFPHTPGIDAAGTVVESSNSDLRPDDEVIVTGYNLGTDTDGGFGQFIRVPVGWVVKRPDNLSLLECMVYGTAGFTAGQCLFNLEKNDVDSDKGDVLVTGATGGVGSIAIAILKKAGYSVVAATGKTQESGFLNDIGARSVIHRDEISDTSGKPLLKSRWAGVVDTVGGNYLATAISSTAHRGAIAACGLVSSPKLSTTVYPFILRGVKLLGIDSAFCPMERRLQIWNLLANKWKISSFDKIKMECKLEDMNDQIDRILAGKIRGRVVLVHDR